MTWQGARVLAVVPARGGSRGIPRKNLQVLDGRTLVAHAIGFAQTLAWVDATVLSTDSEEIAAEGRRCGIDVPFLRPAELATDRSKSVDAWRHAWLAAEEIHGRFEISLLLQPTSPLRTREDAERTVATLVSGDFLAAATVSRNPGHFTPEKTLVLEEDGTLRTYLPEGQAQSIRQLIPPYYHFNGNCYAARRRTIVDEGTLVERGCAAVEVHRPVVNIDEPLDLELAAWLREREDAERRGGIGDGG